jgi:hypothetical protein
VKQNAAKFGEDLAVKQFLRWKLGEKSEAAQE